MILAFAFAASSHSPAIDRALETCKPALARQAGGAIQAIEVRLARRVRSDLQLKGEMIVFLGMGSAPPGAATTHHLIRSVFTFVCETRRNNFRSSSVTPLN